MNEWSDEMKAWKVLEKEGVGSGQLNTCSRTTRCGGM